MGALLPSCPPLGRQLKSSGKVYKKLDEYQRNLVGFCLDAVTPGLFAEQGTGKTYITGGVIEQLWQGSFTALLIVPLTNLDSTWLTFLHSHFPRHQIYDNWDDFSIAFKAGGKIPRVLVIHYEAVRKWIKKLRKFKWSLIVYDESQRLKDRGSGQSRDAAKLRDSARRKIILSGTPLEKQPKDLWAQLRFLNPDILGTVWKDFEDEYLEPLTIDPKKYRPGSMRWHRAIKLMQMLGNKRKFREDKVPQFITALRPYCVRVTKGVLNLLPLNVHPVPISLYGDQKRIYDQLSSTQVAYVDDETIIAPLKITLLGKLHQICGGSIKDEDGQVHIVGRAKLRKTLHLIRTKTKPIVVFCRYREEIRQLEGEVRRIIKRVEVITGSTKKAERPKLVKAFQAGKIDVLICQLKTGGVGLDLFRACVGILYSLSFSYIDYDQAMSRLHRRGQENEVDIFVLYARGTVDEDIFELISSKRNVTRRILAQLEKNRWQKTRPQSMELPNSPRRRASIRSTSERSSAKVASSRTRTASTAGTARRNSTRW